jgi:hypothetical protein
MKKPKIVHSGAKTVGELNSFLTKHLSEPPVLCTVCREDIAVELDEKSVNNLDGSKSHLDCYLRLKKFPTEIIDRVMNDEIAVRQDGNGGVTVLIDMLPKDGD